MELSAIRRIVLTALAAACGLAAESMPVFELIEIRLPRWNHVVDAVGQPVSFVRFPTPAADGPRHFRLRVPGDGPVWVNGYSAGTSPVVGLDGLLRPRGSNVAAVAGWPTGAGAVLITPRVFIADSALDVRAGRLSGTVWIRNTLDNTTNVFLTVEAGQPLVTLAATVPPGLTQPVAVSDSPARAGELVWLTLEKQEEAVEGGYRFRVRAALSRGVY